jgi:hypothetical protein
MNNPPTALVGFELSTASSTFSAALLGCSVCEMSIRLNEIHDTGQMVRSTVIDFRLAMRLPRASHLYLKIAALLAGIAAVLHKTAAFSLETVILLCKIPALSVQILDFRT